MPKNQTLIEDILTVGGNVLGNLLGARHEMRAQTKQRVSSLLQHLDLVNREEFDAAFSMLSKTRLVQENLNERLKVIEARLQLSNTNSTPKSDPSGAKKRLPSVKKDKQRSKRR